MADGMTNEERRGLCKFSRLCRVPVERCHEAKMQIAGFSTW